MNARLSKCLFSLCLLLFILILNAQKTQSAEISREACQTLVDEAMQNANDKNYADALEKLLKAEVMASENQWKDKLWDIENRIGVMYLYASNFAEALDYFQESYAITNENEELQNHSSAPLSNIGLLYLREMKYNEASDFFRRAYDLAKKSDSNERTITIANNLAITYNELGDPEKGLEVLSDVEEHTSEVKTNFKWQTTYVETLFRNGRVAEAKAMAEQLYVELEAGKYKDYREECHTCITQLLSDIYEKTGKLDLALFYAEKSLNTTDDISERIKLYEDISDLYLKKGNHESALLYKDSVVVGKDSLSALINRNLYETNKVRFRLQEYNNEIKRKDSQRNFFIAITVFSLMLSFLIYKVLRSQVVKQRQKAVIANLELEKEKKEHLLAEKQLETNRLKQQQLKHEIAEKNRELSARALYLSNRNELIHDIINSLEASNNVTRNKETSDQIKIIKNFLKADSQQEDFIRHFESVNPDFLKRLKEKHPQLTDNDVRFLCYIFMNLSLKEICIVLNITYDACKKRKRRIVRKMHLDKERKSLYDYLLNI